MTNLIRYRKDVEVSWFLVEVNDMHHNETDKPKSRKRGSRAWFGKWGSIRGGIKMVPCMTAPFVLQGPCKVPVANVAKPFLLSKISVVIENRV